MFCRHRAILPTIIRRVTLTSVNSRASRAGTGGWQKDIDRNRKFKYVDKPFREPKKPHNIEKENPRYKIVDDAELDDGWSPHDWTGVVRPHNKHDYIALVPKVDATLSDLLGSNFFHRDQNIQFRLASMKFNQYWANRRITRAPQSTEQLLKRHKELFTMDTLNEPRKRERIISKRAMFRQTIGTQDPRKGIVEIDEDQRRKVFKTAQKEFDIVTQEEAEHKAIIYDEVVTKVWAKTGMIKSYAAIYKVLQELKQNGFKPRTMLDFGCGAGPGLWAANDLFKDNLAEYTGIDNSVNQLRMARYVVTGGHPDVDTPGIRFKKNIPEGTAMARRSLLLPFLLLGARHSGLGTRNAVVCVG